MTKQEKTPLSAAEAVNAPEPDPRAVREAAGLEQGEMAALLDMGDYGYAAWERGARTPGGPAKRLIALIAQDPRAMVTALRRAAS